MRHFFPLVVIQLVIITLLTRLPFHGTSSFLLLLSIIHGGHHNIRILLLHQSESANIDQSTPYNH